jgi:hypothetical protein
MVPRSRIWRGRPHLFCLETSSSIVFGWRGTPSKTVKQGQNNEGYQMHYHVQSVKRGCFDCLFTIPGVLGCHDELSKGTKVIGISSKSRSASKTISTISINVPIRMFVRS